MQISVTARGTELTNALREYANSKAQKVYEFFKNIQKVEMVLEVKDIENALKRQVAEIRIWAAGNKFIQAISAEKDMYAAIDLVIDEAKHQIEKFKEKKIFNLRRKAGKNKHDLSSMEPNV
jgi:putative sigma-54 modulation protein